MEILTAIVPCFNEEAVIPMFYDEIMRVAELMKNEVEFEVIMVDDGSKDKTLELIRGLRAKDKRIKVISFSRNFGKEAAMYAGLTHAHGDYVAVIDADLQHPPEMLIEMHKAIKYEGFYSACARRSTRTGENPVRAFLSRTFYSIMGKLSGIETVQGEVDYRLMSRPMVDSVLSLAERNRFTKGIFSWVGYNTKWLPYENVERAAGESKWSFRKLFKYSMQGITSFSTYPLGFVTKLGSLFCIAAFIMIIVIVVKTIVHGGDPVPGYPSLACFILFMGGVQLMCMGVIGEYIGNMYTEIKRRPVYIAKICETDDPDNDKNKNM